MKAFVKFFTIVVALCWVTTAHAQGVWRIIAPPQISGAVNVYAFHVHKDSILLLSMRKSNDDPQLLRSGDGGQTWTDQTSLTNPPLTITGWFDDIISVNDTLVAIAGGYIFKSYDDGQTWVNNTAQVSPPPLKISYNPTTHKGFAPVGSTYGLQYTEDGWNTYSGIGTGISQLTYTQGIAQIGSDTVLVGTNSGQPVATPVVVTHNGGLNWFQPTGLPVGGACYAIDCKDQTCVAMVVPTQGGLPKKVYKSTDAGVTWVSIEQNIPNLGALYSLNQVSFLDSANQIITAKDTSLLGLVYRTVNGGQTWTIDSVVWTAAQSMTPLNPYYISTNSAYAIHTSGLVLKYELLPSGVPTSPPPTITVSPNPVNSQFTVTVVPPTNGTILLINSLGQIVINQLLSGGPNTIQRNTLPAGVYSYLVLDQSNNVLGNGQLLFL